MSTESSALTVIERASLALGAAEHEKKLIALASGSTAIVAITNSASYQECHSARMALKRARIDIEKIGDTAREDARDFVKAVIAEQKRLIGIVEPEEARLQAIQDAHDAKIEAEKQARARAEQERVARIQAGIDEIKQFVLAAVGCSSATIAKLMDELEKRGNGAWAQEFQGTAEAAKVASMNRLNIMHAAAVEQEAEAARLKIEREELERQKAAQAERDRQERQLAEEGMRRRLEEEKAARERIEAEQRASREKIEAEERAARLARQAREEVERQERAARQAEADRVAKEQAERDRILKVESDRLEAEKREIERRQNELLDGAAMLQTFIVRFGKRREFDAVVRAIKGYLQKKAA